jgi:hypothetical protein
MDNLGLIAVGPFLLALVGVAVVIVVTLVHTVVGVVVDEMRHRRSASGSRPDRVRRGSG